MIERSCQGLADIKLNYKKEYIFYPWNYCVLLWKLFGPVWLVWKNLPGFDSMGNYCCLSNGPQGKQPIWWLPNDVKLPRHKYDNKCDSECDKTMDNCEGKHAWIDRIQNFAPSVQCIDCANREKSNKRMRETLKLLLNPIILWNKCLRLNVTNII